MPPNMMALSHKWDQFKEKMMQIKRFITTEQKQQMMTDFRAQLKVRRPPHHLV